MKRSDVRAQLNLSFGMIFSIILIVIFISFAFYAVIKFLDVRDSVEVGSFRNDLQEDINDMWRGSQGSQEREYSLPGEVEYVCFGDFSRNAFGEYSTFMSGFEMYFYENENLFFYPSNSNNGLGGIQIRNVNLQEITSEMNPFCVENIDGKVTFTIKKEFGEALVTVE